MLECKYLHYRKYMATNGNTFNKFHKCKVNSARKLELFIIRIFKRWKGRMQQGRFGKGGPHTPKYLDQFLTVFCLQPSQLGSFLQDNQNKAQQPYVLIAITNTSKYHNQFLMVLLEIFTTRLFLQDNQNKKQQPYVLTAITHSPKYLETFTTGFLFEKQSKQVAATLCFGLSYTSVISPKQPCSRLRQFQ